MIPLRISKLKAEEAIALELVSFLVFAAVCCAAANRSNTDSASLVQRDVYLHRSGDVDCLVTLHTEDAKFVIPGQNPMRERRHRGISLPGMTHCNQSS